MSSTHTISHSPGRRDSFSFSFQSTTNPISSPGLWRPLVFMRNNPLLSFNVSSHLFTDATPARARSGSLDRLGLAPSSDPAPCPQKTTSSCHRKSVGRLRRSPSVPSLTDVRRTSMSVCLSVPLSVCLPVCLSDLHCCCPTSRWLQSSSL